MTEKSERIERLMNDPDLEAAFDAVEQRLYQMFRNTPSEDAEALMDIKRRLVSLDAVKQDLMTAIEDGKYEDQLAEQDEQPTLGVV